jgi:HSP20 family protein
MNLIQWEPFKDTEEFFRSMTPALFGRWPRWMSENGGEKFEWAPAADITETETEYVVKAELPGVKREDVKVTLADGVLRIEGERKHEKEEKGEKSHRVERFFGSFCRAFSLPDNADANNIRAESKDGVLQVHVPKLATEKSKAMEIKVQ